MASVISNVLRNSARFSSSLVSGRKPELTSKLPASSFAPRLFSTSSPTSSAFEFIKVEKKGEGEKLAVITLNRPKALNAFCDGLMKEVSKALDELEVDPNIACCIVTGNGRAFAAGADIKEMQPNEFAGVFGGNFLSHWNRESKLRCVELLGQTGICAMA